MIYKKKRKGIFICFLYYKDMNYILICKIFKEIISKKFLNQIFNIFCVSLNTMCKYTTLFLITKEFREKFSRK